MRVCLAFGDGCWCRIVGTYVCLYMSYGFFLSILMMVFTRSVVVDFSDRCRSFAFFSFEAAKFSRREWQWSIGHMI